MLYIFYVLSLFYIEDLLQKYKKLTGKVNDCHFIPFHSIKTTKYCLQVYFLEETGIYLRNKSYVKFIIVNSMSEEFYYFLKYRSLMVSSVFSIIFLTYY